MNQNFETICQGIADELGIEIIDVYEDGGSPSEFNDDGMLHVIEGMTRVVFDVSENQRLSAKKQNDITRRILGRLSRPVRGAALV